MDELDRRLRKLLLAHPSGENDAFPQVHRTFCHQNQVICMAAQSMKEPALKKNSKKLTPKMNEKDVTATERRTLI